jgi:hypothetical protein
MKSVILDETATTEDWVFSYQLLNQKTAWSDEDEVVLAMSPDFVSWDDYGRRSRTFPPSSSDNVAPWFQASSRDDTGVVTLIDPNIVSIVVPWNQMRMMGPGGINVGLTLRREDPTSRTSLLVGRLPVYDGVG